MSPNHDAQSYRPPTISELAERGKQNLWDPAKPLKHWLRTAEAHKRAAQAFEDNRDLENAFLEYAKAATIVVDKIPSHSEYHTVLNPLQRKNLGLVSYYILYMILSFRAFTLFGSEVSCLIILMVDVALFIIAAFSAPPCCSQRCGPRTSSSERLCQRCGTQF